MTLKELVRNKRCNTERNKSGFRVALGDSELTLVQQLAIEEARRRMRRMRKGIVPEDFTSKTSCTNCGEVPVFPGVPTCVLWCPWCWVGGYQPAGEIMRSKGKPGR